MVAFIINGKETQVVWWKAWREVLNYIAANKEDQTRITIERICA